MNAKKVITSALCGIAVFLCSCSQSDDSAKADPVSEKAKEALVQKFPDASNVNWKSKGDYVIADFKSALLTRSGSVYKHAAWFDNAGFWYMTETELEFDQLPEAVREAFLLSEYAGWKIDDIDRIERYQMALVYVIEVEQKVNGKETELDLYYSEDGILIRVVVDDDSDYEDFIPSVTAGLIFEFLATYYPDARILDIDVEDGFTEVEILDRRIKRELLFNTRGEWLSTQTEICLADVPVWVLKILSESDFAALSIDDIEHFETPAGEFYRFELEGPDEVTIDILPDGSIRIVRD